MTTLLRSLWFSSSSMASSFINPSPGVSVYSVVETEPWVVMLVLRQYTTVSTGTLFLSIHRLSCRNFK